MTAYRQTGSSSTSRYLPESSSLRYATESSSKSRPVQSTRLSTKGGDELLIRSSSRKENAHPSPAADYVEKTVRGPSRRESAATMGGGRTKVPSTSPRSRALPQTTYNDRSRAPPPPPSTDSDRSRAPPPTNSDRSRAPQTNYNDGRQTVVQSPNTPDSRRPESSRAKTVYDENEMRASTRGSNRTHDDDRAVVPGDKEGTSTRKTAAPTSYKETRGGGGESRALVNRVQTLRDDDRAMTRAKPSSSSSSSRTAVPSSFSRSDGSSLTQLGRRVEKLEDEKSRRLERQVEKLTDQVEQLKMDQMMDRRFDYMDPGYSPYACECDYCLYSTGPICMVRL